MLYDNELISATQGLYNNKKSNFANEEIYYGPTNAMNDRCSTCPNFDACADALTDCKALRFWYNKGTYKNEDVQVNLKKAA